MLFDIFNNFAFVDIKSVGKFLKEHILCKTKIILVRGTELFPAFGKLLTAKVQRFDKPYDLMPVGIFNNAAVFFLALDVVVNPYTVTYRLVGVPQPARRPRKYTKTDVIH